ncbi:MAG: aminopeptidase P family protein [Mediterranea sp.]|jgi:Xaa-Pro aminopeptidase|nr:aminopeptidase P family protein [Mediterranea sp.]
MEQQIKERLAALRATFRPNGVEAFIVPGTDPHLSEYVAPHWMARQWISGFTGSAGTVVVTHDDAGLWTDSRYFIQAGRQLEGSGITLYKEGLPDTPSILAYLRARLPLGAKVGIDGTLFAAAEVKRMAKEMESDGLTLASCPDPFATIWANRPARPSAPAYVYDTKYAGKSCAEKLADIRAKLAREGVFNILLSSLDEIAWTLNLRGSDVHCTPVVVSYLLITRENAILFIDPAKVTPEVDAYLTANGIARRGYDEIVDYLRAIDEVDIVQLDPKKTNFAIVSAFPEGFNVIAAESPVPLLKAVRNPREIAGVRTAMIRDGVALVKFLRWLDKAVPEGRETELSAAGKLHEFRAAQPLFVDDSFDTIAGYKEHGAIVHYTPTPETDAALRPEGFLLLDSGAQYLDGTTDITRTIALGKLTEEEKIDYTLVLKGHIALAQAKFPAGTRGAQLDVLARLPLWRHGENYLHGTGHGVGHFLSVHEGPQSIRMNENPVPLVPGMVTSNEPGVYKEGSHGVRTENLTLVREADNGMYGDYYEFETLTLCPICTQGILDRLMTDTEKQWIDDYHRAVSVKLSPYLDEEERLWLRKATAPLM